MKDLYNKIDVLGSLLGISTYIVASTTAIITTKPILKYGSILICIGSIGSMTYTSQILLKRFMYHK